MRIPKGKGFVVKRIQRPYNQSLRREARICQELADRTTLRVVFLLGAFTSVPLRELLWWLYPQRKERGRKLRLEAEKHLRYLSDLRIITIYGNMRVQFHPECKFGRGMGKLLCAAYPELTKKMQDKRKRRIRCQRGDEKSGERR